MVDDVVKAVKTHRLLDPAPRVSLDNLIPRQIIRVIRAIRAIRVIRGLS